MENKNDWLKKLGKGDKVILKIAFAKHIITKVKSIDGQKIYVEDYRTAFNANTGRAFNACIMEHSLRNKELLDLFTSNHKYDKLDTNSISNKTQLEQFLTSKSKKGILIWEEIFNVDKAKIGSYKTTAYRNIKIGSEWHLLKLVVKLTPYKYIIQDFEERTDYSLELISFAYIKRPALKSIEIGDIFYRVDNPGSIVKYEAVKLFDNHAILESVQDDLLSFAHKSYYVGVTNSENVFVSCPNEFCFLGMLDERHENFIDAVQFGSFPKFEIFKHTEALETQYKEAWLKKWFKNRDNSDVNSIEFIEKLYLCELEKMRQKWIG